MLERKFRLPASVKLRNALLFKTPLFVVKIVKNDLSYSRFGFVVKKTIDKRATVRNRIRRLVRSCIEELRLEIVEGYDMLFFLEKGIIDNEHDTLCQEIQRFLASRNLLK